MSKEQCHPNVAGVSEQWQVFSAAVSDYIQTRTETAIASDNMLILIFKLVRKETRSPRHAKRVYMKIACAAMRGYLKEAEIGTLDK